MNPMYDAASLPDRIPFGPAPPPGAEPAPKAEAKPYDENEDLPCLMWDTVPDNPDNADLAAMQSLMYDECTAAERAENFKVLAIARWTVPQTACMLSLSSRTRNVPPFHRRHASLAAIGGARAPPPLAGKPPPPLRPRPCGEH
jgi:hypothetical protein